MKSKSLKMTVNFNNLRKQAFFQLQELSKQLEMSIITQSQYAKPNDVHHNQDIDIKNYCLIDSEDIEDKLNPLLSLMSSICSTFEPGNNEFKDLSDEIGNIEWFKNSD